MTPWGPLGTLRLFLSSSHRQQATQNARVCRRCWGSTVGEGFGSQGSWGRPRPPTRQAELFLCSRLPQCPHPASQCRAVALTAARLSHGFLLSLLPRAKLCAILVFTRVLAAKLDVGVADVGHSLAALLVTGVHAVGVPVTAPPQGDAQAIQPALELVTVAATRRSCGCRGTGAGHRVGVGAPGQPSPGCLPNPSPAMPSPRL